MASSTATLLIINNLIVVLILIAVSILNCHFSVADDGTSNSSAVGVGPVSPEAKKIEADPNGIGTKSDAIKDNSKNDEKSVRLSDGGPDVDQEEEVVLKSSPGKTKEVVEKYIVHRESVEKEDLSIGGEGSSSSFMTYFIVLVIVVVIVYIAFHNRHKIMAYIIEGRRVRSTGQRRTTSTTGASTEYRPLTTADELSTGRIQTA